MKHDSSFLKQGSSIGNNVGYHVTNITLNKLKGASTPECVDAGGTIELKLQQLVCCQEQQGTVALLGIRVGVGAGLVEVG